MIFGMTTMTDAEKLKALVEAYRALCSMFSKDPMKCEAYRSAVS